MNALQTIFSPQPGASSSEAIKLPVILPDGRVAVLTASAEIKGDIDSILTADSQTRPFRVPYAGKARGAAYALNFIEGACVILARPKAITMATSFSEEDDGSGNLYPSFDRGSAASYQWVAPEDCELVLMGWAVAQGGRWKLDTDRVYLMRHKEGRFSIPPLPNLYTDGRICCGNNPPNAGSINDQASALVGILNDAPFNGDLLSDAIRQGAKRSFRWGADGAQLPPQPGALDAWAPISTPQTAIYYNGLPS